MVGDDWTSAGPAVPPTARLELRPLRVEHADEMAVVLGDPRLHAFIGGEPDDTERLRARYRRMTAGSPRPDEVWLNWVVRLRDEDRLVGTVQATVVGRTAEIAWVVGVPWQGRGIAREAVGALVDRLSAGPVDALVAHIHPDHIASAAVARSAGLSPTDRWHDGEIRWELRLAP
ncbi:GNAT family N-acetyltransferase [Streptomyces sp. NPDC048330]|uniref:GNAT family N-acetyltransferase n=1 Tax=Streptomyces sp. NPDC048330 TaxID=3365533 RepID=UPI00371B5818